MPQIRTTTKAEVADRCRSLVSLAHPALKHRTFLRCQSDHLPELPSDDVFATVSLSSGQFNFSYAMGGVCSYLGRLQVTLWKRDGRDRAITDESLLTARGGLFDLEEAILTRLWNSHLEIPEANLSDAILVEPLIAEGDGGASRHSDSFDQPAAIARGLLTLTFGFTFHRAIR